MSGISRRGALAGIVTATALAPTITTAHAGIGTLWEQRQTLAERAHEIGREWDAAQASIPTWARPGPEYINSQADHADQTSGWPLDASIQPPQHPGTYRKVRVSPRDIWERFETDAEMFPKLRADLRDRARSRMRKLLPLLRAQKAEYAKAGIREIEQRICANSDAMFKIEKAIEACPPSLDRAAAMALCEVILNCLLTDTIETDAGMGVAAVALDGMLPSLSGLIATHARFFIQNRELPLKQMPFVGG